MEYKAEIIDGQINIKPNILQDGSNVIIQVPTLSLLNKFQTELKEEDKNGSLE